MKKFFQIKKNYFIEFFLLIYFSFFLFRGRLGSDDLEVYNLVLIFKEMNLSLSDFANLLKNNYTDLKLSSKILDNTNQLPDFKTLHVRFIWFFQSYLLTSFVELFSLSKKNYLFISQYLCGYIITFYTCLSFLFLFKYFKIRISYKESLFLSFIIFFSTGLISFFTGSYIESLIILLIILRFFLNNNFSIFWLDIIILLIKPYYYLILAPLYLKNLSTKNFIKKTYIPILLFISIYIFREYFFNLSYDQYKSDYSNFNLDISFIFENFINQFYSLTSGIIITCLVPLILVIFGYQKNQTIFKILGTMALLLFFSLFEQNHGQVPGGRYFLPSIFIFIDEFLLGFKSINIKFNKLFYLFFLITILNLPTLEYRNFNLPHYIYDSSSSGKVVLLNDRPDLYNFPMRKIYFNHTVFSNKILFSKILNNQYTYVGDNELQNSSIYPMTGVGRVIFIINSEKEYYKKKLPNIFNNLLYLFYIIYICTMIFVITTFIMTLLNIMRILYKK
jgi:hypothetical protein